MVTKSKYINRNNRSHYYRKKNKSNIPSIKLRLPLVSIQQLLISIVIIVFIIIVSKIPQTKFKNISPKIKTQLTNNIKIENIQNSFENYMEKIQTFNPFEESRKNISKK